MEIDQPFGNGRGGIHRLGVGVRAPPKIGLDPSLKEVAHRDEIKRSN